MGILTALKRFPRALFAGFSTFFGGVQRVATPSSVSMQRCQSCGEMRLTKFVSFYRNVGMFFRRREYSYIGNTCKGCVHRQFWKFEFLNVVLGPWGMISAIVAPIYFVQNIFNYIIAIYKLRGAETADFRPLASKSRMQNVLILASVVVLILLVIRGTTKKEVSRGETAVASIPSVPISLDQSASEQILCGTLKSVKLFQGPNFQTAQTASLACGENVAVLDHQGDWTKLRTQNSAQGFVPKWFVGLPANGSLEKSAKCNRPSPMDNPEQFKKLKSALDGFVDAENFSAEFQEPAHKETEDLAAGSYFLAYLTAENPGKTKAEVLMGAVTNPQLFGSEFSKLSGTEQSALQTWFGKTLNVMSKAFDLGYEDGAKLPCNPK
jgi:hypothetical protein